MGKKTRRPNRVAATNSAATATMSIDVYGRVPERNGRAFYALLDLMILLNVPQMEKRRRELQGIAYVPLRYNTQGFVYNSMELRAIVINFLLMDIDLLASEIEDKKHDRQILATRGKVLTADELRTVKSWTVHIQDDFLVVDHIPNKGAVFVQLGRSQHRDLQREIAPSFIEGDVHEPRVFIVRSLDTPIQQLLGGLEQMFSAQHPIVHEFPDLKFAHLYTTLVPYGDGIQYMSVMTQPAMGHLVTPLDYDNAIRLAAKSYHSAFGNTDVEPSPSGVKLYMNLHPDKDIGISRLASDARNVNNTSAHNSNFGGGSSRVDGLHLFLQQTYWNPYRDLSHPNAKAILSRITGGQRPLMFEGVKMSAEGSLIVPDGDACPFHRRVGSDTVAFSKCCKKLYMQWMAARNTSKLTLVYEPIDQDLMEHLERAGESTVNITQHMRVGNIDSGKLQVTFEPYLSAIIKHRLDQSVHFHAVTPYMWTFLGERSLRVAGQGLMVFGDVDLHPSIGMITCETMTVKRMAELAPHIKDLCFDLDILSVEIQSTPMPKSKPDLEGFDRIRAAFQEGLESVEVTTDVNKAVNKKFRKRCAYCADTENEALKRCMCKAVYYCGKECQGPHWKEHAKLCKEIRKAASATTA